MRHHLQVSPDGKWIAYPEELTSKGSTVYRVDVALPAMKAASARR